ncbi:MAG: YggS family pyridoxal phosphate-dependent enzyme [Clostridia bacterium]|nr:YggS family pyridoxal phosphate-dependent enzyme [Clostridia bacterium]
MTEKLSDEFQQIKDNLEEIEEKITRAAEKSGRKREDIILLAATKTVSPEKINYAISCGLNYIGENRVQELESKFEELDREKTKIHLIGHLQSNKINKVLPMVDMIESVDSIKLAKKLSQKCIDLSIEMPILLELNIANEESKSGFKIEELTEACYEIAKLKGIKINGIMSVPPMSATPEENRKYLSRINQIFIDIQGKKIDNVNMHILSAGMSGDYEVAIEEGSNLVRLGSSIFGRRQY